MVKSGEGTRLTGPAFFHFLYILSLIPSLEKNHICKFTMQAMHLALEGVRNGCPSHSTTNLREMTTYTHRKTRTRITQNWKQP